MTTNTTSVIRNSDSNYGINFMRGALIALPISAAFWGAIALALHAVGII